MSTGEIIFVVIWWILLAILMASSIWNTVNNHNNLHKKKKPKNKTDYPYLPLGMITKHFGWSYEYVDKKGWRYVIWYKSFLPGGGVHMVETLKKNSRTEAGERCEQLEDYWFGPEDLTIYRKDYLTDADVISPADVTLEELLFNKEKKMKTSKIKDVKLVIENKQLYLDLTYELKDDCEIRELHIPRVELPIHGDVYPEVELDYDDLYEMCFRKKRVTGAKLKVGNTEFDISDNSRGDYYTIKTIEEKTKKMTVAEIEKKLGYKIEIVSEDKK